jgi:ABC-type Na+ efflux pump permease subunit
MSDYCQINIKWYNRVIMKKYTIAIVLSLFALVAVSNVFAGGGFEDYTLNPDGTVKVTTAGEAMAPGADGVTYDENGNIISQEAAAGSALDALTSPKGIGIALVIILIVIGLIYWSYRKSKPAGY